MSHIPILEHYCNSWIVTRKSTNVVIGEFYNINNVSKFDPEKCLIETSAQYLAKLNKNSQHSKKNFL